MNGETTTSLHDFLGVTLRISVAGARLYWELTGNVGSVSQSDRERIAALVASNLAISHEKAYAEVWSEELEAVDL